MAATQPDAAARMAALKRLIESVARPPEAKKRRKIGGKSGATMSCSAIFLSSNTRALPNPTPTCSSITTATVMLLKPDDLAELSDSATNISKNGGYYADGYYHLHGTPKKEESEPKGTVHPLSPEPVLSISIARPYSCAVWGAVPTAECACSIVKCNGFRVIIKPDGTFMASMESISVCDEKRISPRMMYELLHRMPSTDWMYVPNPRVNAEFGQIRIFLSVDTVGDCDQTRFEKLSSETRGAIHKLDLPEVEVSAVARQQPAEKGYVAFTIGGEIVQWWLDGKPQEKALRGRYDEYPFQEVIDIDAACKDEVLGDMFGIRHEQTVKAIIHRYLRVTPFVACCSIDAKKTESADENKGAKGKHDAGLSIWCNTVYHLSNQTIKYRSIPISSAFLNELNKTAPTSIWLPNDPTVVNPNTRFVNILGNPKIVCITAMGPTVLEKYTKKVTGGQGSFRVLANIDITPQKIATGMFATMTPAAGDEMLKRMIKEGNVIKYVVYYIRNTSTATSEEEKVREVAMKKDRREQRIIELLKRMTDSSASQGTRQQLQPAPVQAAVVVVDGAAAQQQQQQQQQPQPAPVQAVVPSAEYHPAEPPRSQRKRKHPSSEGGDSAV